MVSLTLFGKSWKTRPKIQNNYGILISKHTGSRQNFEMTMSSLKCHLKSFENQSSAKNFVCQKISKISKICSIMAS